MKTRPPDYTKAGEILEIPKLSGLWRRMPDEIRYDYEKNSTECPVCLEPAAGNAWGGWFTCDYKQGCCVALVDTGEVFMPVGRNGEARPR